MASKKQVLNLLSRSSATILADKEGKDKYSQGYYPSEFTLEIHNVNGSTDVVNGYQFSSCGCYYRVYHVQVAPNYLHIFHSLADIEKWARLEELERELAQIAKNKQIEDEEQALGPIDIVH